MTDTLARALAPSDTGIDRRKLLKMGVWAAPVVVLATAAPAAAASGPLTEQQAAALIAPSAPTNASTDKKVVAVKVAVNGTASTVIIATITVSPSGQGTWNGVAAPANGQSSFTTQPVTIPAGGSTTITFPEFQRGNQGHQLTFTVSFSVNGVQVPSRTQSLVVN
ncbi:hypothetical protein [Microbacterium ureisolvens]|uniref:Uncharacterized protein n=1 Tax=Microbacterium ureisolvens TaxID=2781186 RepID=A0ABS7I2G5_9MICO|nr:hypothetical protein [Microbacterium ureisolvens]MBW9110972.1 hypothetical protein [Microbacterium ureisolvens]